MSTNKIKILLTLFLSLQVLGLFAQVTLVPFVSGVNRVTDIKNCGDNRLFILEQTGKVRISDLSGNLNPVPYLNIISKVNSNGTEQGLLGIAFSPTYATDGRFYLDYTNTAGNTVIARYTVDPTNPDLADTTSGEILLTIVQPFTNHNGGSMQFGKDGFLYIGMGDGGSGGDPGNRAQNLQILLGKILRMNVNTPSGYSIPSTNPFFTQSATADPLVWAYGVRNPWRTSFDRATGDFWIADVGQDLWEEVDIHPADSAGGQNYGWRCYEANVTYNTSLCTLPGNFVFPIYDYHHGPGCSITGGYVYRGAQYGALFGKYIFTDYCQGVIRSLEPNGLGGYAVDSLLAGSGYEYTTFGEDVNGELYVGKNSSGVLKLVDATCQPTAFLSVQDTINYCGSTYQLSTPAGPSFSYQWTFNGTVIPNASTSTYNADSSGTYLVTVVNGNGCVATSAPVTLNLFPSAQVFFTGVPNFLCESAGSLLLTGSPTGGVFSGFGVTGSNFNTITAGVGTHTITYTYNNPNGCVVNYSKNVVVDACLSINESTDKLPVNVFPNPAGDNVFIEFQKAISGKISIELFDVEGRKVLSTEENDAVAGNKISMNLEKINRGIYFLKLTTDQTSVTRKLIRN